jgi:hypothetical protein
MGTIILSSSPPGPFARSPTPAASSSPAFASPSSIFGNGHKRFKTAAAAAAQRDGFSDGFSTARKILGAKVGSENLPFVVTKSLQNSEKASKALLTKPGSVNISHKDGAGSGVMYSKTCGTAETSVGDEGKKQSNAVTVIKASVEAAVESVFVTEADVRPKNRALSPLLLDKAPSRRLDWTPPSKYSLHTKEPDPEADPLRNSFPAGLLERFSYEGASTSSSFGSRNDDEGALTKRRKLDLIDNGLREISAITAAPKLAPASKSSITATTKRSKSPKKKYTTITGLATSHYFGDDQRELEARPMLQYLAATQTRDIANSEEPAADMSKRKRASKKPKAKKKSLPTPVLLSPESAMKAIDGQNMVFGSASQLARDESPSLLRDIIEATKQSESSISCTPVQTQITVPSEPGSATSRRIWGTSRFTKSRNLWATASRDEDNALLQVDTIDLFDSPGLRLAFAGKDAMLEPTAPQHREPASPDKVLPELRGRYIGRFEVGKNNSWLDIDDIGIPTPKAHVVTKSFAQTRTMHTASEPMGEKAKNPTESDNLHREGAERNSSTNEHELPVDTSASVGAGNSTESPRLQMPAFSGFTTQELSNQIKKYGFKPLRKREKMIEVLQTCWEAKHKPNGSSTNRVATVGVLDDEVVLATHGDILSNVHGLTARPIPKVPKTKFLKPKKDKPATPTNTARRKAAAKDITDVEKTPKGRKKAEPRSKKPREPITEKVPRKRKAKASALSAEYVIDISDIEDTTTERPDTTPKPLASATAGVGHGPAIQPATRVATSPPPLAPIASAQLDSVTPRPPENFTPDLPDINSQITDAITKYVASPLRDHQRDPTWHEKILIYDPIVLEDLAAWLNTEGLGLVGEDREVSALEVRAWCEMKGVCCYGVGGGWRGNVKDKARASGGEIED